jgi:hypothetical protein
MLELSDLISADESDDVIIKTNELLKGFTRANNIRLLNIVLVIPDHNLNFGYVTPDYWFKLIRFSSHALYARNMFKIYIMSSMTVVNKGFNITRDNPIGWLSDEEALLWINEYRSIHRELRLGEIFNEKI